MEPKITIKEDYILVEAQELDYLGVLDSHVRLFKMPEYLYKNVIWMLSEDSMKGTFGDLYKIKNFVEDSLPENIKPGKKVALVVETGFQTAIAEEYTKIAKDLPLEFKVFSSLKNAEDWITA